MCRGAQLAMIRQMSGQVSRGSAGEYKADEQAVVPVVLEKTLESPLDCKEIQPVHPKGNQS